MIKRAELVDLNEILALFEYSIRSSAPLFYSQQQIEAWTASVKNRPRWEAKIREHEFFIARDLNNELIGFASLKLPDYLDLLFVHPDYQGKSVATQLFNKIEEVFFEMGQYNLRVHASYMAKPIFEHFGFNVIEEEIHQIADVSLRRWLMQKTYT